MSVINGNISKYDLEKLRSIENDLLYFAPIKKDTSEKYIQDFDTNLLLARERIKREIASRSVIHLGPSTDDIDLFTSDLNYKAQKIESILEVDANLIIEACKNNIEATMDFINLATKYIDAQTESNLNELINWFGKMDISNSNETVRTANLFVTEYLGMVAEFLQKFEYEQKADSLISAEQILVNAFEMDGFEDDLTEIYKYCQNYNERTAEIARLLVHYNILNESFQLFVKQYVKTN